MKVGLLDLGREYKDVMWDAALYLFLGTIVILGTILVFDWYRNTFFLNFLDKHVIFAILFIFAAYVVGYILQAAPRLFASWGDSLSDIVVGMSVTKLVFFVFRFSLIPFFIREVIQRKSVTIILYHDIKPELAEKHFKILTKKYNIISLRNFLDAYKSGEVHRLGPKLLIVTFDDGRKDNYKLLPLFEKYKIPATIFLCAGVIDTYRHFWFKHVQGKTNIDFYRKVSNKSRLAILKNNGFEEIKEFADRQSLTRKEIDEMKEAIDFQSHVMFHPCLPYCSDEKAYEEIVHSKNILEDDYGLNIYAISYPNGDYCDRDIRIAKEAGYQCGITVDIGFNSQTTDLFRLKRFCIRDEADINELLVKASGLWAYLKKIFVGHSFGYTDADEQNEAI